MSALFVYLGALFLDTCTWLSQNLQTVEDVSDGSGGSVKYLHAERVHTRGGPLLNYYGIRNVRGTRMLGLLRRSP